MIVLAIDTSDARGDVTLLKGDVIAWCKNHVTQEDYSGWLLPAVKEVLTKSDVKMQDVDVYGVAAGPGSFTGVRVGLTTVKGWAEVYGKPIVAVSRLEALALQASAGTEYVAAWMNARREQVFGALYKRSSQRLERLGDEMVIASGKFVQAASELAGEERIAWATTDPDCVMNTAEWAKRKDLNEGLEVVDGFLGGAIARMAAKEFAAGRTIDTLALDANYVRRSDAEVFWKGNAAHGTAR